MTAKQVEKKLLENGFTLDRVHGSHKIYVKKGFPPISVPFHGNKDLKLGTLKNILKTAGIGC
ncbi:type II toxin-antitoxin system HicA family toxin [uncultured Fibrobacter sp.]|jgi:predicted RNA binding protein YcfA (HicA-like mRNA interferase family)|uniref:type II toxin-antitoxin system HicA family toxin n=1 Tax=uncultured Fibrobacter sp. TaxID=261512 RepID=UPI00345DBAAD